jgi:hypothetical protein
MSKKKYINPVAEFVETEVFTIMSNFSAEIAPPEGGDDDGRGDSGGGTANEYHGNWNDIWGGM